MLIKHEPSVEFLRDADCELRAANFIRSIQDGILPVEISAKFGQIAKNCQAGEKGGDRRHHTLSLTACLNGYRQIHRGDSPGLQVAVESPAMAITGRSGTPQTAIHQKVSYHFLVRPSPSNKHQTRPH